MTIAAADVKPAETGPDMKSIRNPEIFIITANVCHTNKWTWSVRDRESNPKSYNLNKTPRIFFFLICDRSMLFSVKRFNVQPKTDIGFAQTTSSNYSRVQTQVKSYLPNCANPIMSCTIPVIKHNRMANSGPMS